MLIWVVFQIFTRLYSARRAYHTTPRPLTPGISRTRGTCSTCRCSRRPRSCPPWCTTPGSPRTHSRWRWVWVCKASIPEGRPTRPRGSPSFCRRRTRRRGAAGTRPGRRCPLQRRRRARRRRRRTRTASSSRWRAGKSGRRSSRRRRGSARRSGCPAARSCSCGCPAARGSAVHAEDARAAAAAAAAAAMTATRRRRARRRPWTRRRRRRGHGGGDGGGDGGGLGGAGDDGLGLAGERRRVLHTHRGDEQPHHEHEQQHDDDERGPLILRLLVLQRAAADRARSAGSPSRSKSPSSVLSSSSARRCERPRRPLRETRGAGIDPDSDGTAARLALELASTGLATTLAFTRVQVDASARSATRASAWSKLQPLRSSSTR